MNKVTTRKPNGGGQLLDSHLVGAVLPNAAALIANDGTATSLMLVDGRCYTYDVASTATVDGGIVLAATGRGVGRWIGQISDGINIKKWYGAIGNGVADDTLAINKAIAYVRTVVGDGYGVYRPTIIFPDGFYRTQGINGTNCNGLCIRGLGGSYLNASLIGIGTGAILDFTGSSQAKATGLTFISNINELVHSPIGVLFALGEAGGGLNATIDNCFFQMDDDPTANGGIGSLGVVNVRSEEFAASDCLIRANAPVLMTNKKDVATELGLAGAFSLESKYTTIATGIGSMTVACLSNNMSLQCVQRRREALMLVNTGSISFMGYLVQYTQSQGSQKTAIGLYGQAQNMKFEGTIESFARVGRMAGLNNDVVFRMEVANQTDITTELFDVTSSVMKDCYFGITMPNVADIGSRMFLYHAPINNGDSPATGGLANSTIACSDWVNNTTIISANMLKQANNTVFMTGQPFAKRNGAIVDLKTYGIPIGTITTGNPEIASSVIRFNLADKTTKTSGNGGYYAVKIIGQLRAGDYTSAGRCVVDFESNVVLIQAADGSRPGGESNTLVRAKIADNPAYLDLIDITPTIEVSGTIASVRLYVKNAGSGIGQPVVFLGRTEVTSDFLVNQSIIYN